MQEKGNKKKIGEIDNKDLFSYPKDNISNNSKFIDRVSNIIIDVFDHYAKLEDKNTNPGFVILNEKPESNLYFQGVRDILTLKQIKDKIKSLNGFYRGYKNSRGLIGATASIAWNQDKDRTYELISYRYKDKWGSKRYVDDESVKKIDKLFPSTFDNYDYDNKHNRIMPNSPCQILYGVRGDNPNDLIKLFRLIKSEKISSWILFETNQGTDDHIQNKKINQIMPFESVIVEGKIIVKPHTIKGGHVLFTISDNNYEKIDCAAYEPTKKFRNIIRELLVGDFVEVYGGVRRKPLTINIEKINVKEIVDSYEKLENPICPKCKKHMKSKGKNMGYKCLKCKITELNPVYTKIKRDIKPGFYEVPVCARRHLSKPLKRF